MQCVLLTKAGLAKVGVELLDSAVGVKCKRCGAEWLAKLKANGYLPSGWWHCPNGCNHTTAPAG
jgi:hypothetical protein